MGHKNIICLILALFTLVLPVQCVKAFNGKKCYIWRAITIPPSSVVWSPDGMHIAFVSDGIWILSLDKQRQPRTLKRIKVRNVTPSCLFWLDGNRIGWANQGMHSYRFVQTELDHNEPKALIRTYFKGIPVSDSDPFSSAPNDVYYDAGSRKLMFSGSLASGKVYVRILPLSTKKVITLSIPITKGLIGSDIWFDAISVCGSLKDPKKPVIYIAASLINGKDGQGGSYLWRSDSYRLRQDKIISTDGAVWPRTSPDGKLLACMIDGEVTLYNLKSGNHLVLAKQSIVTPYDGCCPFSWSPDGKKIAYADGSSIKIINVPTVK